jgi:outer membrane protein OmpA-like peptidoglycan-associated protein
VSKVLENPNTHVVVDSSRFRGYIVDVIVVSRDYLAKHEDIVKDVIGSYFRAAYRYRASMVDLIMADAKQLDAPLTQKQAESLVEGVWWKNTQENFAHFGIREGSSLQHIEDVIENITKVLTATGAIGADPTAGHANLPYYDQVLRDLLAAKFHPGLEAEGMRDDTFQLPELADAEWDQLVPVGTLQVPLLVFARGTDRLTERSEQVLSELAAKLGTSHYYVLIRGNASRRGSLDANKRLAAARAEAAAEYLVGRGVDSHRIRARGVEPSGETSVTFMLGQTPY